MNLKPFDKMKSHDYPKGTMIACEGDVCQQVGIVKKGRVKISSVSLYGNEILYKNLGIGDLFGDHLIFSQDKQYNGNITAEEDCSIIFLSKEDFLSFLSQDKKLLEDYLSQGSLYSRHLNQTIHLLALDSASERFDYYLEIHHGEIPLKSVSDLARNLHLSRENTSRLIHQLEKENKIILEKERILKVR